MTLAGDHLAHIIGVAHDDGNAPPPNILMIMTFTGRPSSSATAGLLKNAAARMLAPASRHLVVDKAFSIILWPSMEYSPSGCCRDFAWRRARRIAKHFSCLAVAAATCCARLSCGHT